jgi:hypothetical protein
LPAQVVEGVMLYLNGFASPNCDGEANFDSLQCQGRLWRFLAIQAAWTVCIIPLNVFIVTPDSLWAPGIQKAADECCDTSLRRLRILPWLLLVPVTLMTLNTFIFWTVLWDELSDSNGAAVVVHFVTCLVCFCLGTALLLWSRILHESFALLFRGARWCGGGEQQSGTDDEEAEAIGESLRR